MFVGEPVVHVVMLHCVEGGRRRPGGSPEEQRDHPDSSGDEGRDLVPRVAALVDDGGHQVVSEKGG